MPKKSIRDEFRPDEISILEDALEDAWRRVKSSKTPWASEDYSTTGRAILAKHITRWLRAANATPDGWPTARFFTSRNKN